MPAASGKIGFSGSLDGRVAERIDLLDGNRFPRQCSFENSRDSIRKEKGVLHSDFPVAAGIGGFEDPASRTRSRRDFARRRSVAEVDVVRAVDVSFHARTRAGGFRIIFVRVRPSVATGVFRTVRKRVAVRVGDQWVGDWCRSISLNLDSPFQQRVKISSFGYHLYENLFIFFIYNVCNSKFLVSDLKVI